MKISKFEDLEMEFLRNKKGPTCIEPLFLKKS